MDTAEHAATILAPPAPPVAAGGTPGPLPPRRSRFDVFLSHASADKPAVTRIALKLREAGIEPWLDVWCLTPGGRWQEELAEGVAACAACAVFLGPGDLGSWELQEFQLALDRAAHDRAYRLFPVLLPGVGEPFDPSRLPPFLALRTWVDLRAGFESAAIFQALVNAVKGVPFAGGTALPVQEGVCPYQGLRRFDEERSDFFFGREGDVQRLLEKLKATRFLAVLGPSGSGKSSLVRAGLLPALRAGAAAGSDTWAYATLTPGTGPLAALAAAVAPLGDGAAMQATLDQLRADRRSLHLAASLALAARPTARLLLVVDQLEEVFTLARDEAERRAFLDNLVYAANVPDGRCVVVPTLRADFYQRCSAYPELAQLLGTSQFLVTPLDEDGLREAIEEPARRVGLSLEEGLVATIVEDVAHQPGALPLLQHALLELWERRRGTMLTLEGYRESGGVQGALAQRADEVVDALAEPDRELARRILLRLTEPGRGTEDTRRRATRDELVGTADDPAAVDRVVAALVDGRLVTTGSDEGSVVQWAEVSHEALIRSWPRLRRWLEDDREGLLLHNRLAEAAQDWKEAGRDEGALYRGVRLAQTQHWLAPGQRSLNELEQEFVAASVALDRATRSARRRRVRLAIGSATVAFLLVGAAAVYAFRESDRARHAARLAESRQVAAVAVGQLDVDPERSLLLAREAARIAGTDEAVDALRQALQLSHLRRTLAVGSGEVWRVSIDRTGRLVTAGADGVVRLWRPADGSPAGSFPTGGRPLRDASPSPDGTRIATGGAAGVVGLWEAASGRRLQILHAGAPIADVAWSADGTRVAAAAGDGVARVWRVRDGRLLRQLARPGTSAESVAFDPSGRHLLVGGGDGLVDNVAAIWDLRSGQVVSTLEGHADRVMSAVYSPDGRRIATADSSGAIRLWGRGGDPGQELRGHRGRVWSLAFAPDGRRLVSGGSDGTARLWDTTSGSQSAVLRGHRSAVLGVAFDRDGTTVATAGADGTARLWSTEAGGAGRALPLSRAPLEAIAFRPDGAVVAAAGKDGLIRLATPGGRLVRTLSIAGALRDDWIEDVAWRADGGLLATAGEDAVARLWNPATGRELHALTGHALGVRAVAFGPDGALVATASRDGTVRTWDVAGHPVRTLGRQARRVDGVAFLDDRRLVSVGEDGTARIWDLAGRTPPRTISTGGAAWSVATSEDGSVVATGADSGVIELWAPDGARTADLRGHDGRVWGLAFAPDGRLLASASDDGTARVWDLATDRVVAVLRPAAGPVRDVSFAPDGRTLALATESGSAFLYRCALCGSVDDLRRLAAEQSTRALSNDERRRFLP